MKINYVIATYNGKTKRRYLNPLVENTLRCHINKILELKNNNISQITIMKAKSSDYYTDYYNIHDLINKSKIPIKIIDCENYGYSAGQWLKAYELYYEFDYYIFMEDDYCPGMNNYDDILVNIFKNKFKNNIGLLCSTVKNSRFPTHFNGGILVSNNSLKLIYSNKIFCGSPRKHLNLIEFKNSEALKKGYLGGYYQVAFSHLFTLTNITIEDYIDIEYNDKILNFPYWNDTKTKKGGEIYFLKRKGGHVIKEFVISTNDIYNSPIIPVQLHNLEAIKLNANIK